MISHLIGAIDNIEGNKIVVDVAGVGYLVNVPRTFFSSSPKVGDRIKVHTCQVVREDDISLYGFPTKEERSLFTTLLSVNGIGPKGAMSMISEIPLNKLVAAIARADEAVLSSVKGIGLKTAQRVIIELKEKVARAYSIEPSGDVSEIFKEDPLLKDAISALITLGYSPNEARQAIKHAGIAAGEKSIEEVIKKALKSTAGPQVYRTSSQVAS